MSRDATEFGNKTQKQTILPHKESSRNQCYQRSDQWVFQIVTWISKEEEDIAASLKVGGSSLKIQFSLRGECYAKGAEIAGFHG